MKSFKKKAGKFLKMALLVSCSVITFAACGGGGGGGGAAAPGTTTGTFLDSAVDGLTYTATPSGLNGATQNGGQFNCKAGDTVGFAVGDVNLGQAPCQGVVTPVDLVTGATDETNPVVTNIARFLQSLDADHDPSNGINIDLATTTAVIGKNIDITDPNFDTDTDAEAQALFNALGITPVTASAAKAHLRQTLTGVTTFAMSDLQGAWNFSWLRAGDNPSAEMWAYGTITITDAGTVTGTSFVNSSGGGGPSFSETWSISPGGIITLNSSTLSFHGVMTKDKNTIVATLTDDDGYANLLIFQKSGGTFTTADLAGTWKFSGLSVGTRPKWYYGTIVADANGSQTFTYENTSDSSKIVPSSEVKTTSISSSGILSGGSSSSAVHGAMSTDKKSIIITLTEDDGSYDIFIAQKSGGTFAASDLQGTWNMHGLVSGSTSSGQKPGWFRAETSIESNGNFTFPSYNDSENNAFNPTGTAYSLASNGIITVPSSPSASFHGAMSLSKDFFVLTATMTPGSDQSIKGYNLIIGIK